MEAPTVDALKRVLDEGPDASGAARPPVALGDPLPWDFESRARVLAARAESILDLTTGDGELLAGALPDADPEADPDGVPFVVAADRRGRHLAAARERLRGRAALLRASPEALPFADRSFDLVLLRHRPFDPRQLAALVRPGGALLTEQIHVRNWREIRRHFPRAPTPADDLERNKKVFRRAGFELIDVRTHDRPLAFDDLEHFVHVLAAAPWIVPELSIDEDAEALFAFQEELQDERGIVITRSRYVLEVHRPQPME